MVILCCQSWILIHKSISDSISMIYYNILKSLYPLNNFLGFVVFFFSTVQGVFGFGEHSLRSPCMCPIRSVFVSGSIYFSYLFPGFLYSFLLSEKKYENKYGITQCYPFPLHSHPYYRIATKLVKKMSKWSVSVFERALSWLKMSSPGYVDCLAHEMRFINITRWGHPWKSQPRTPPHRPSFYSYVHCLSNIPRGSLLLRATDVTKKNWRGYNKFKNVTMLMRVQQK